MKIAGNTFGTGFAGAKFFGTPFAIEKRRKPLLWKDLRRRRRAASAISRCPQRTYDDILGEHKFSSIFHVRMTIPPNGRPHSIQKFMNTHMFRSLRSMSLCTYCTLHTIPLFRRTSRNNLLVGSLCPVLDLTRSIHIWISLLPHYTLVIVIYWFMILTTAALNVSSS